LSTFRRSAVQKITIAKRLVGSWQIQAVQLQRPTCPADRQVFCRPCTAATQAIERATLVRSGTPEGIF
jgi:hypothetical protein